MALRPANLTAVESATVALSALTAFQALFEEAGWTFEAGSASGKSVVVTAASGAVGQWLVQLAKLVGAKVIATTGPDNIEYIATLGADVVINYRASSLKEWFSGPSQLADVVIDCRGGKALEDAWYAVKDGGLLLSIAGQPGQEKPKDVAKDAKSYWWVMHPDGRNLAKITTLIEEGKTRHSLDSVYRIEDFEAAFQRTDSGHAKGKVVIDVSL